KKPIALFANGLSFYHPITKELLTFEIKPEGEIWSL
ncbi:MAG: RluA family pseudouridine synthase, partial [Tenericutes bacterium]|nr:RluA family pseudouridine synthase [Mycoplasmatota bacterium]